MKSKRLLSALTAGITALGMFGLLPDTALSASAKKTQLEIMDIADSLYSITWKAKKTIDSYGKDQDEIFYEGKEYHIPYGMTIDKGMYIGLPSWGWVITIDRFIEETKNADSLFYTDHGGWTYSGYSNSAYCPYYGMDCSSFVSYCWDLSARNTTYGLPGYSTNYGLVSEKTIDKIELGDALNNSGHVMLISDVTYDTDGKVLYVEITQETPPALRRDVFTREEVLQKYSNYYILQYAEHDSSLDSPHHEPYTKLEKIGDGIGGVMLGGWAYDIDAPKETLDIQVWVGGDRGTPGAYCSTIKADTATETIKTIYAGKRGMDRKHGFNKLAPVLDRHGRYDVYVYAINKGEGSDVFLGSQSVEIKPIKVEDLRFEISEDFYLYDGKAKTPEASVYLGTTQLVEGKDYSLEYIDNDRPGTAKAKITGLGVYDGTAEKEFTILCTHENEDVYESDGDGRLVCIHHHCPICGFDEDEEVEVDYTVTPDEDNIIPETVIRYENMTNPTVKGSVLGGRDNEGNIILERHYQATLTDQDGNVYEGAVKGANFKFDVPVGFYRLAISKDGCVTKEQNLMVNDVITGVCVEMNKLGDISKDGIIEIEDAVRILAEINGYTPLDKYEEKLADVNYDEEVNVVDAVNIINFINGISLFGK